jgi:hypothetical protein
MAVANEAPPADVRGLEEHFEDKPAGPIAGATFSGDRCFGSWDPDDAAESERNQQRMAQAKGIGGAALWNRPRSRVQSVLWPGRSSIAR